MLSRQPLCLIRTRVRPLCFWGVFGVMTLGAGSSSLWAEQRSLTVEVSAVIPEHLEIAVEPVPATATAAVNVQPHPATPPLVLPSSSPALVDIHIEGNLAPPHDLRRELTDVLADTHHLTAPREYPLPMAADDPLAPGEARNMSYQFRVEPGAPSGASRGTLLVTFTAQ